MSIGKGQFVYYFGWLASEEFKKKRARGRERIKYKENSLGLDTPLFNYMLGPDLHQVVTVGFPRRFLVLENKIQFYL